MSCTLERVSTLRGAEAPKAPSRRAPRPLATPALNFRMNLRVGDVEAEAHVLDHPGRQAPAGDVFAFLAGRSWGIGLDRYASTASHGSAPPLGMGIRLLRPVVPIARGYHHAMQVEFLAAFRRPRGGVPARDPAPGTPPAVAVHDVTTGDKSPAAKGALAGRIGRFALEVSAMWADFPADDWWAEQARLAGVIYDPAARPVARGRSVVVYLRDAAPSRWDREVPPACYSPKLLRTHTRWMHDVGRPRVGRSCGKVVAAMRCSGDHAELRGNLGRLFARA